MANFESKKELAKLKKIFADIPKDRQELVAGLITDASFMAEQLEILREHITKNGWSEPYKNGANQFGKKSSAEGDAYIKLQKLYAQVVKQLQDQLPQKSESNTDDLINWIAN